MEIYVGNLSYDIDEEQLEEVFSPYGKVDNVNLIRYRNSSRLKGFGFVSMSDVQEANDAIEGLDGSELLGRAINVKGANPKTEESRPSSDKSTRPQMREPKRRPEKSRNRSRQPQKSGSNVNKILIGLNIIFVVVIIWQYIEMNELKQAVTEPKIKMQAPGKN